MFVTGGARDSEGTPLLRVLAGGRHFSAPGKASLRQLTRMWTTLGVGNRSRWMPARLSFPIHDMSGGEASSMVWAFLVQVDYFRVARHPPIERLLLI